MKKTVLAILVIVGLVFVISCRNQPVYNDYTTNYSAWSGNVFLDWATLFDAYWHKMNTNYVFWDVDDGDGHEWDRVYEEYYPKFQALGAIYTETTATSRTVDTAAFGEAKRYFYDICKDLSDGHYMLWLYDAAAGVDLIYQVSPATIRHIKGTYDESGKSYGATDDEVYKVAIQEDITSDLYKDYTKRGTENTFSIAFYTLTSGLEQKATINGSEQDLFTVDNSAGKTVTWDGLVDGTATKYSFNFTSTVENPFATLTDETAGKELYFFNVPGLAAGVAPFVGVVGYAESGVLYFSFEGFSFSSQSYSADITAKILEKWQEMVTSDRTEAVIVDLRGNVGGQVADLSPLWTPFMNGEKLIYGAFRRKGWENRTTYGPWTETGIKVDREVAAKYPEFDLKKPIVVLTNHLTGSCAEITTLFFSALREKRSADVTIMGEHTNGGFGSLTVLAQYYYNGGWFYFYQPIGQIYGIYTPYQEIRYLDGVNYEGTGFPVDEGKEYLFKYSNFIGRNDVKYNEAVKLLESKLGR